MEVLENSIKQTDKELAEEIETRASQGVYFTLAGGILLSIKQRSQKSFTSSIRNQYIEGSQNKPHLYTISLEAYQTMKIRQESQVISVLGPENSGKSFNTLNIINHLVWLSTQDEISLLSETENKLYKLLHDGYQLLHILGSVKSKSNKESTICGLRVDIAFDFEMRAVGGKIDGALLEINLPKSNKRTFQILHSLEFAEKETLHRIGMRANSPSKLLNNQGDEIYDWEVWERFTECLVSFETTKKEFEALTSVLAAVIHLYDIHFVLEKSWNARNRFSIEKVCKLLGTSEDWFTDCFCGFPTKAEAENRIHDLARTLYCSVFLWVKHRVNLYLEVFERNLIEERVEKMVKAACVYTVGKSKEHERMLKTMYTGNYYISVIDFPGFTRNKSLGGLSCNLAVEGLEYFCASEYLKLLSLMEEEEISMPALEIPRSKLIFESFLARENGIFNAFANPDFERYLEKLWTLQCSPGVDWTSYMKLTTENELKVKFSWGSVSYNLQVLEEEAQTHFTYHLNTLFMKKCSNSIIVKEHSESCLQAGKKIGEKLFSSVTTVIRSSTETNNFLVYSFSLDCIERKKSILKQTLVFPLLLWEEYGFSYWVTPNDILEEFGHLTKENNESVLEQAIEIIKEFGGNKFEISKHFVLLHEEVVNKLKATGVNSNESDASFSIRISPFSQRFSDLHPNFSIKLSWKEGVLRREELKIKTSSFDLDSSSNETSSSFSVKKQHYTLEEPENIITANSKSQFSNFSRTIQNYYNLDYSDVVESIIKIESLYRGWKGRQVANAYKHISSQAALIQTHWKGYSTRKTMTPILAFNRAIIKVQRFWKARFAEKTRAAKKIQRFYRKKVNEKQQKESYIWSSKSPSEFFSVLGFKSIEIPLSSNPSQIINECSFSPFLSNRSRKLAKIFNQKHGYISVENRFEVQEAKREHKLHNKREEKLEEEGEMFSYSPKINKKIEVKGSFFEREAEYALSCKMKREIETFKKEENFAFEPKIGSRTSRSPDEVTRRLYTVKKRPKEQPLEIEKEEFKLSDLSILYAEKRKKKLEEMKMKEEKAKKSKEPHWAFK